MEILDDQEEKNNNYFRVIHPKNPIHNYPRNEFILFQYIRIFSSQLLLILNTRAQF